MKNNSYEKCFEQSIVTDQIAQAYVPMQKWCPLSDGKQSLLDGTVFPVLVK